MNKQDNKLTLSVLAVLTAGIALAYTLIMYNNIIFAVAGTSILFLITAYILTQNIITYISMRNKSTDVQLKKIIDDLTTQLEGIGGSQAKIGKATYLYTRQTAKAMTALESHYTDSQKTLYRNLISLSNAQNKATKLMIKYDQNNTMKLIASMRDLRNRLNETMVQGFDQIRPNNDEVVNTLQTIVDYLKSQPDTMDQTMSLQLNNVAHELQSISNSIQNMQIPIQGMMHAAPAASVNAAPLTDSLAQAATESTNGQPDSLMDSLDTVDTLADSSEDAFVDTLTDSLENDFVDTLTGSSEDAFVDTLTDSLENDFVDTLTDSSEDAFVDTLTNSSEDSFVDTLTDSLENDFVDTLTDSSGDALAEILADSSEDDLTEMLADSIESDSTDTTADSSTAAIQSSSADEERAMEEALAAAGTAKSEPASVTPVSDDPNKQLSPDEIAALFASTTPAQSEPEAVEASAEDEAAFTPTFTVVGKSEENAADSPNIDPNKQLSPDEIASLFAAADPAPKKAEKPAEPVAPVDDNPNNQLSPDEIAALFAASEPAPKPEEEPEPPKAEPVNITPVSSDPNKQLSPDEIAALFSQMG